jgi:hypothetical protein
MIRIIAGAAAVVAIYTAIIYGATADQCATVHDMTGMPTRASLLYGCQVQRGADWIAVDIAFGDTGTITVK